MATDLYHKSCKKSYYEGYYESFRVQVSVLVRVWGLGVQGFVSSSLGLQNQKVCDVGIFYA